MNNSHRRILAIVICFVAVCCVSVGIGVIINWASAVGFIKVCRVLYVIFMFIALITLLMYIIIKIKRYYFNEDLNQILPYIILIFMLSSSLSLLFSLFSYPIDEFITLGVLLTVFGFVEIISIHASLKIWP